MDSHRKNDSIQRKEKRDDIESEEETVEFNFLEDQKLKQKEHKSLLHKKRHTKERDEEKDKPYLKRGFDKVQAQRNYIKTEKKSTVRAEIPNEYQSSSNTFQSMKNELESKIQILTELNIIFQRKIKKLEDQNLLSNRKIKGLEDQNLISNRKIKELEKQNLISNRKIKGLEDQNFNFYSKLKEHEVTQQKLEKENNRLQQSVKEKIVLENNLLWKVDLLNNQVEELNQFHFQVKLRKLLKRLIEYLLSKFYPEYMQLNKLTKRIEFSQFPLGEFNFELKNRPKIINILNMLLDKIFVGAKKRDYIVHFVEPRAVVDVNCQRYIPVFQDPYEFFKYFDINSDDGTILIQIIPKSLFMEIDNFRFEKNIKELIRNYDYNINEK